MLEGALHQMRIAYLEATEVAYSRYSTCVAIAAHTGSTAAADCRRAARRRAGPGEVLCRTLELGICGTDREILHSANPWTPPGEDFLVLGHECLARIEAVGSGVSRIRLAIWSSRPSAGQAGPDTAARLSAARRVHRAGHLVASTASASRCGSTGRSTCYRVPAGIEDLAVFAEPLAVAEKGVNEAHTAAAGAAGRRHLDRASRRGCWSPAWGRSALRRCLPASPAAGR